MGRGREDGGLAWVALRLASGVGDVTGRRLVERFGSPAAALDAAATALTAVGVGSDAVRGLARARDHAAARVEAERVAAEGARLIAFDAAEYPARLRELPDAPLYLVARGAPLAAEASVAVVGARHATPYGLEVAERLGAELGYAGMAVVSGLARGVDGAAHRGALAAGGQTIAVLGCGIDVVYPPEHRGLAEEVARSGTLVSERPVGAPPLAAHFPARNRIIAGMTLGTVVVEAGARSGALITAEIAVERNREVFAVPGRIDAPLSAGPHRLIQRGAKLVGGVDDIVSEIAAALGRAPGPTRRGPPAHVVIDDPLVALLRAGPVGIDRLVREIGTPMADVLTHLLELEIRGVVEQLPGKRFQIAAERRAIAGSTVLQ